MLCCFQRIMKTAHNWHFWRKSEKLIAIVRFATFLKKKPQFWGKTDNNNQIFKQFDHNKRIFLLQIWTNRTGLLECDNINRMITLSVITLSGFHCNKNTVQWNNLNILFLGCASGYYPLSNQYCYRLASTVFPLRLNNICIFLIYTSPPPV